MNRSLICGLVIVFFQVTVLSAAGRYADITVAADGSGDHKSLTEALNTLPMYNYQRLVIYIKNGIYHEKILIDRDYITLLGESQDSTIIEYSQLRSDWQAMPDNIGAAVVNITADDIILENLTIRNTQPQVGPHAFAIYGTGTRTVILNCNVTSQGGDTVSLWNYKDGMYYHANCYFEGGVDFVCPRGSCYIRDSKFYENSKTAAIWHAAVTDKNQRMVLKNCSFDGVQGYYLARHHYEAEFFFLDCTFSATMDDKPILHYVYPDEPEKNRPYFFGDRYYFYNSHRANGDYTWHRDNIASWPGKLQPVDIDANWTFNGKWDPESEKAPLLTGYKILDNTVLLFFDELLCVRGKVKLKTATGIVLEYHEGNGRDIISFKSDQSPGEKDFRSPLTLIEGEIIGNTASAKERPISVLYLQQ